VGIAKGQLQREAEKAAKMVRAEPLMPTGQNCQPPKGFWG
jgi:hypothetical protein